MSEATLGLYEALEEGVVEVTFTKADGTDRVMTCTLNKQKLVDTFGPFYESWDEEFPHSDSHFTVLDLEVENWRSFRNDRVKSWRKLWTSS